jgi:DNA-3-methyladenine glycosylase II
MHNHFVEQATQFLSTIDSDWAELIQLVGPCKFPPITEREPYEALVRAVAYQQLHPRAGDAILARLLTMFAGQFPTPKQLALVDFDELKACGFSGRKTETLQGIAHARLNGIVPSYSEAETMTNEILIERLVTLKGIGRWTVEMMLIFTLARQDILPIDDFGIREGYKRLKRLDVPPTPKALATIGEAWQPYRSVASWYLWRVPK